MQLILAWIAFPAVLVAVGAGWGTLIARAAGHAAAGALLVALGLLAAMVAAAALTASAATAPAAVPVVAAVAVAGLATARPRRLAAAWPGWRVVAPPLAAALGALLAHGAPVILSGQATFAGYAVLDDTASWLGLTDQLFAAGRSVATSPASTYGHVTSAYLEGSGYPSGAFMLLGIGRGLVGVDAAWVLQPYLALCGALIALATYALLARLVPARGLRAGLAFVAAQPALLYGFGQWGAVKELTAAWVIVTGLALVESRAGRAVPRPREMLVVALPAAALVSTLGAGALVWIAPALAAAAGTWIWNARREHALRALASAGGALVVITMLLALPALLMTARFLATDDVLFAAPTGQGDDTAALGALTAPLSAFQLIGIWPVGDLRLTAPTLPTAILVALALAAASYALAVAVRRRAGALARYAATAVVGVLAVWLAGGSPWVIAKALAIGSPAVLAAALAGGALLMGRSRALGIGVCALLCAGVLWSNALAYHGARLAPRPRLAELQRIGEMIAGRGPTLLNEYEVYGTRHFLRAAAPSSPSEYRALALALRDGQRLGDEAHADLDAFPHGTLLAYRTIVTARSPTQSRPPSTYRRVWRGRWYEVWTRPREPRALPVVHLPGGDSNALPYCGTSDAGELEPCSVAPAARPPCALVRGLRPVAADGGGRIVAFERPSPIVVRLARATVPAGWTVDGRAGHVMPSRAGMIRVRVRVRVAGRYVLWVGGSFARGVDVSLDGRRAGRVAGARLTPRGYERAGAVRLRAGDHELALRQPRASLGPGGGAAGTVLAAVVLEPVGGDAAPRMLDVAPRDARTLCGRTLDWIEVVAPPA